MIWKRRYPKPDPGIALPLCNLDLDQRYDVYTGWSGRARLYKNVKINGLRVFQKITGFTSSGLIELEDVDGDKVMILASLVSMVTEAGVEPKCKLPDSSPEQDTRKDG